MLKVSSTTKISKIGILIRNVLIKDYLKMKGWESSAYFEKKIAENLSVFACWLNFKLVIQRCHTG